MSAEEAGNGGGPETAPHPFALPEDRAQRDRLAEIGQIAGGLVHELKNPLGAIELNLEMLLDQAANSDFPPDKTERRLRRIAQGTSHLRSIVDGFLAFARPGRPDPDRVDVNALIGEILDEQAEILARAGIAVAYRPVEDLRAVPADPNQLRIVFLNIVLNARDALLEREDDRRLWIVTRNHQHAIRVVIANNGPPLTEKIAAHLFEPFYSGKERGTGLGLAIVRRLVELHGGKIAVSSDPDQGVSFTIELPTELGPARPLHELPLPEVHLHDPGSAR